MAPRCLNLFELSAAFVTAEIPLFLQAPLLVQWHHNLRVLPLGLWFGLGFLLSFAGPWPFTHTLTVLWHMNWLTHLGHSPQISSLLNLYHLPNPMHLYGLRTQIFLSSLVQPSPLSPSLRSLSASLASPLGCVTDISNLVCQKWSLGLLYHPKANSPLVLLLLIYSTIT